MCAWDNAGSHVKPDYAAMNAIAVPCDSYQNNFLIESLLRVLWVLRPLSLHRSLTLVKQTAHITLLEDLCQRFNATSPRPLNTSACRCPTHEQAGALPIPFLSSMNPQVSSLSPLKSQSTKVDLSRYLCIAERLGSCVRTWGARDAT